ncbi:MAG: Carbohydrate kinase family protein [Pseudomonadota bacterium]|jgi:sugar/nucleoside kinase (ribokinase family)|nr:carbohydrate kinase family protein [Burkholderiales bacterium]MBP9769113.1 carbohydrate kinase family protein [Burkholderiales bacterium]MDQ5948400.1 Carbohydrate kinase family protein [Pseudomonadota bacterium]
MSVAAFSKLFVDIIYAGLDKLPNPGEEIYSQGFDIQLGGGAALLPIVLNRLNVPSKLGTFLANDLPSKIARELLSDLNFTTYTNFYDETAPSPVAVSTAISMHGDRSFISFANPIDQKYCSEEQVYNFFHGSKLCFALAEYPEVMKKLRGEGTLIVYDTGWSDDLSLEKLAPILQHVDIFTPNDKEALKLTGVTEIDLAVEILARYVKYPVVTVGKNGSISYQNKQVVQVAMPCEFAAIDTTGAGDNFMAGLVYGFYHDWDLVKCMQMANVLGGYSTTQFGCYKAGISEEIALKYLNLYPR